MQATRRDHTHAAAICHGIWMPIGYKLNIIIFSISFLSELIFVKEIIIINFEKLKGMTKKILQYRIKKTHCCFFV